MASCCPPTLPDSRAGNRAIPSTPLGRRPHHFLTGGSAHLSPGEQEHQSEAGRT